MPSCVDTPLGEPSVVGSGPTGASDDAAGSPTVHADTISPIAVRSKVIRTSLHQTLRYELLPVHSNSAGIGCQPVSQVGCPRGPATVSTTSSGSTTADSTCSPNSVPSDKSIAPLGASAVV